MKSVFTAFTVLLALGTHWILYRWAIAAFPRLFRLRLWVAVALIVVVVAQVALRALALARHGGGFAVAHGVLFAEHIVVAISAVPIALVRIATWFAAGAKNERPALALALAPAPNLTQSGGFTPPAQPSRSGADGADPTGELRSPLSPPPSAPAMTRRQIIEASAGIGFLGATGAMLGWGMVRGRHAFVIEELPVKIPGLPRALDGYTIAQISDLHVGLYVGERVLDEGLARVAEAKPDLLVATGDLVDFDPWFAELVARKLASAGSRARDGVVAILGNHDHYAGARKVAQTLRDGGVETLVNAGKRVRPDDGGGFALLGVDDTSGAKRGGAGPILARATTMVPKDAPKILLSHQPASVDLWAGQVALQLSGHTHGGQINPGVVPARLLFHYVSGRYDVRGTTLYVNRGFGTVGPPSRIGAPPEVTKIILIAA